MGETKLNYKNFVGVKAVAPIAKKKRYLKYVLFIINKLKRLYKRHPKLSQVSAIFLIFVMVLSIGFQVYQSRYDNVKYNLSPAATALLGNANQLYASKLVFDNKTGKYLYNAGYSPSSQSVGPRFTGEFAVDSNDMTITDPVNNTSVTFKPKFKLDAPLKQTNRLVYPFKNGKGAEVITAKATNIKEDIILDKYQGDQLEFKYQIVLPDELEARIEGDGSLGFYGPSENYLMGNISTGSKKDEQLFQKARKNAEKNKLIFRTPAPFIVESGHKLSQAKAWYSLKGDTLTVHASQLKKASYPLSIDPSVYVDTAAKLMRGNNESNLDFDVDNELIQKGKLTGARFNSWSTTSMTALNAARWNGGTAVMGGYIYYVGGSSGSSNVSAVYWAHFNTTSYTIESPNPGDGTCSGWCTLTAYNLPNARAGLSLVAYNGFLYAIGGVDGTNTRTNTVYISKVGANGEPQLWHPTLTDKSQWVYWYPSTNTLSTERSYSAAVAYNNRLYLLGGQTNATTTGVYTVEYTNLKPTGDISSWSTTGMVTLRDPSTPGNTLGRHNLTVQAYNDRLYVIGGNANGTLLSSVQYIKLNSDGTMIGNWLTTTPFTTGRMAWGGNFSTMWGGYIYVAGGCSGLTNGYCSTIRNDIQLASVNADGSLTDWGSISSVTNSRIGYGFVGWRGNLYGIGGCTAQNTTNGNCTTTITTTDRGQINQDGDASTVSNSVASGTSPCVSTGWYDCDIPPVGTGNAEGGRMSGGSVINNGFIYYIGGCTAVGNNSVCFTGNAGKTSDHTSYSAIAADGTLVRASVCTGTFYGSWCVSPTALPQGLAAFGYTVFNNVIYAIGGTNGTDWSPNLYRTALNADGSLGAWQTQTFANVNLGNAKGYQYVFTRANPSSAGTYPGNLYVLGGCSGVTASDSGLDCVGSMNTEVYKCNIMTTGALEEADANDCDTANQLQIDSEPGTGGAQGMGVMAGTVYANYVYLIGGQSPNEYERGEVMYAKIDNNNNIVAVSGSTWTFSANSIDPVRRRGVAFGYNGYIYALAGYNISEGGSLNDLLFAKVNVSDGSVGAFSTSYVTVNPRWDLRAIVNNGYVYALGGCNLGAPPANCTTMTGTVQTFQLYNNYSGSPTQFNTTNTIGVDRIGGSSTVLNGYIYYAGGCTVIACTTVTNTNYYAPINADGTIGTWTAAVSTLPAAKAWGKLVAAGGTLYYVGGQTGSATTTATGTIYYTTSISSGVPTWGTATRGIGNTGSGDVARTQFGAAVWNDRIFVVGGYSSGGTVQNTVYASPQMSSGGNITGNWPAATTSFNVARSGLTAIAYANNLYILGGYDGTNYLNDVQYTQINSDGTVDAWSYSTSLPQRTSQADGFAMNGFMYIFGGRSAASTCTSFTYVAPISANTTIASGNNPTGLGEWYSTNRKFTGDRYGLTAAYNDGKAYVLGGGCAAFVASTDRSYYSTLQSQPQTARYSLMIDTDTDVFPTYWLMNGLDNSIGARWYMTYRSSTAANAAWGVDTNFGAITLGRVEQYIPKDGSGTNTNFARYFYMITNIDSQQAFGYPEDVTRGPTIADLSLFFTSDPGKRMRHGKTFTGGVQQPLDTPCHNTHPADPTAYDYNCLAL